MFKKEHIFTAAILPKTNIYRMFTSRLTIREKKAAKLLLMKKSNGTFRVFNKKGEIMASLSKNDAKYNTFLNFFGAPKVTESDVMIFFR